MPAALPPGLIAQHDAGVCFSCADTAAIAQDRIIKISSLPTRRAAGRPATFQMALLHIFCDIWLKNRSNLRNRTHTQPSTPMLRQRAEPNAGVHFRGGIREAMPEENGRTTSESCLAAFASEAPSLPPVGRSSKVRM